MKKDKDKKMQNLILESLLSVNAKVGPELNNMNWCIHVTQIVLV
jgi:hypothetical protein